MINRGPFRVRLPPEGEAFLTPPEIFSKTTYFYEKADDKWSVGGRSRQECGFKRPTGRLE